MSTRELESELMVTEAFVAIESKFGVSSATPKSYHNSLHALQVVSAATAIASLAIERDHLQSTDKGLVKIAAAYHDIEQNLGRGANELASAEIAIKRMDKAGIFSALDKREVELGILATAIYFDDGILRQSATSGSMISQVVADSDLASFGCPTEQYWDVARSLFLELNPGQELEGQALEEFVDQQTCLLANHEFYTPEAAELFPHQEENLRFTTNLIT